ncbi:hypothetical protein HPP92_007865 [Vanilla planifolia]|uniref:Uncharacterized protein n=1 Tax=Vanilla planifolia TaxID=51239 RepID=A0A835VA07_VANPL|nr:hypothetical protein HPP92_007865 [Vanilla planifolia]
MATTATREEKSHSKLLRRDFSSTSATTSGNNRIVWCGGVNYEGAIAFGERWASARDDWSSTGPSELGGDDDGLKELEEKLLDHLREAADKMKLEIPLIVRATPAEADEEGVRAKSSSGKGNPPRPWNLRARTADGRVSAKTTERTIRLRSEDPEKTERQKFSISLSREEIEEDIFALTGSRPRRRPKKRTRNIQGQLDMVFPGLWLSEITPELYRVDG